MREVCLPIATPLRVLVIEDSDDDAALITRELRRGGFVPKVDRVQDEPWNSLPGRPIEHCGPRLVHRVRFHEWHARR